MSEPDVTLDLSLTPEDTMAPADSPGHLQIALVQVVAQPSEANKVIAFDPDPRHLCGLWWQHGPGTLTQMPLTSGLQT